jgi:tetratricopeptide (TPR) repeat protein
MRRTDILVLWAALFLQFFLLDAVPAAAGEMTFEREYTYQAGEADSKLSCRAIALEQVKRLLLEELGTYLESMTEVKNSRLTKDQITTLTAGAVQARIIDEKWDGQTYRIRARIKADPDEVAKAVQGMKEDRQKRQGLEDARRRADEAMKEIQRLRAELEALKEGTRPDTLKKYGEAVRELSAADWFQKAAGLVDSQKPQEAIEAFNKAIELDPKYGQAYNGRGFMHLILGDLQQALRDFTQSIQFDPRNPEPYNNRGIIHGRMGDMEKALQDHSRAVELGPGQWSYYQNRGLVYYEMGKIPEGMRDFTLAIDRNPGGYE